MPISRFPVPDITGPSDDLRRRVLDVQAHTGFDNEEVWDFGAITAFFATSNRPANGLSIPPNPEFHLMGRLPRDRPKA